MGSNCISNRVVAVENIRLLLNSQTFARVKTGRSGTVLIEPDRNTLVSRNISVCHGMHSVMASQPFKLLIANFNPDPVELKSRIPAARVLPDKATKFLTKQPLKAMVGISTERKVNSSPTSYEYVLPSNENNFLKRREKGGTSDDEALQQIRKDTTQLDLLHVSEGFRPKARAMSEKMRSYGLLSSVQ